MARGQRDESAINGTQRNRDEYSRLWRSYFEEARESGSPVNAARFVANQRLKELRAADNGGRRLGAGDYEPY